MLYAVIIGQVQLWPWLWVELTGLGLGTCGLVNIPGTLARWRWNNPIINGLSAVAGVRADRGLIDRLRLMRHRSYLLSITDQRSAMMTFLASPALRLNNRKC